MDPLLHPFHLAAHLVPEVVEEAHAPMLGLTDPTHCAGSIHSLRLLAVAKGLLAIAESLLMVAKGIQSFHHLLSIVGCKGIAV